MPVFPFPLRYLGLPLGLRKPTAAQLQYLVDAVANRLPGWWASMLNRAGHLELVRSTLAAIPIFCPDVPGRSNQTLLAIEKIMRGFLWKGRRDMLMVATAWWHGTGFVCQRSSEGWGL
jgi:hypothetical protein